MNTSKYNPLAGVTTKDDLDKIINWISSGGKTIYTCPQMGFITITLGDGGQSYTMETDVFLQALINQSL